MQKSGRKLMVVALESSRAPDYGRLKEYAPFSFTTEETGGIIGNGDITMDWIVQVLKRTVDTSTAPRQTAGIPFWQAPLWED